MNRPASVAIREFEENIERFINDSGLPPIIIEMIMRGYYIQIREMAKKQTEQEETAFKNEVNENGK